MFDLDNTLYPHHLNLWQQVDERIRDYIAGFLKIGHEEAFRLQKDYYRRYGTSMRGLMTEHGMKPDDFLDFVHQIDHSPLEPNPALGAAIETPARPQAHPDQRHAPACRCGLRGSASTGISTTYSTSSRPSSSRNPRRRPTIASSSASGRSDKAAMFEDLARNLQVPHALGMTTVLVVPEDTREVFREDWEIEGRDAPHVDHVTDDLVRFLETIVGREAADP